MRQRRTNERDERKEKKENKTYRHDACIGWTKTFCRYKNQHLSESWSETSAKRVSSSIDFQVCEQHNVRIKRKVTTENTFYSSLWRHRRMAACFDYVRSRKRKMVVEELLCCKCGRSNDSSIAMETKRTIKAHEKNMTRMIWENGEKWMNDNEFLDRWR